MGGCACEAGGGKLTSVVCWHHVVSMNNQERSDSIEPEITLSSIKHVTVCACVYMTNILSQSYVCAQHHYTFSIRRPCIMGPLITP